MNLARWLNRLVFAGLLLLPVQIFAQTLTFEEALTASRENYPAIQQKDLVKKTSDLTLRNLEKGYLPQISLNAQASYQSDVTRVALPLPGLSISPMDKDQYKATADLTQVLFDGGLIHQQKQLQRLSAATEDQRVEVDLYKVRERVMQLYLGTLLLDAQLRQTNLVQADIKTGIKKTEALLNNGLVFRSSLNSLQAELLKAEQRSIELSASRKGLINALSLFIGKQLQDNIELQMPQMTGLSTEIKRPEVQLFASQSRFLEQQKQLLLAKNLPKVGLFGQGGYGRPGLNMLQNQFDWFYIAGVRLNWSVSNLYTYKKEKQLININASGIEIQKNSFLLNTNAQLVQQKAEIEKLLLLIEADKKIIALRAQVTTSAKAQLENQVISSSDYIREVNAEDQARQSLITHELQLVQAQLSYNIIAGT